MRGSDQRPMSAADIAALEQMAQGEGEMRISKRLMRSLIAQQRGAASGRVATSVDRTGGSARS